MRTSVSRDPFLTMLSKKENAPDEVPGAEVALAARFTATAWCR